MRDNYNHTQPQNEHTLLSPTAAVTGGLSLQEALSNNMAVTSSAKKPISPSNAVTEYIGMEKTAIGSKGKIMEKRISVYANLAKPTNG